MTPEQINAAKQKLNIDLATVSEDRLVELCLLNRAVPSASPDFLTRLKAELERRFTPAVLANDDTMFSVLHKFASAGSTGAYLPKSGGTLEGALKVAYAGADAGMSVANTKPDGVSAAYNALLGNIIKGGMGIRFASDGSANFALQLTPPGDTNSDRTEDYLRVNEDGIWSKKYGMLHEYFALAAGGAGIYHKSYPNYASNFGRFDGEVWWDRQSKLKIILVKAQSLSNINFPLPERLSGMWLPFVSSTNYNQNSNITLVPSQVNYGGRAVESVSVGNVRTNHTAHILAIGWSDQ